MLQISRANKKWVAKKKNVQQRKIKIQTQVQQQQQEQQKQQQQQQEEQEQQIEIIFVKFCLEVGKIGKENSTRCTTPWKCHANEQNFQWNYIRKWGRGSRGRGGICFTLYSILLLFVFFILFSSYFLFKQSVFFFTYIFICLDVRLSIKKEAQQGAWQGSQACEREGGRCPGKLFFR